MEGKNYKGGYSLEKGELTLLRAEISSQLAEIEKIYGRIEERVQAKNQVEVESLSFWLHNLYSAFEDLFEMIARAFENNITSQDHYHIELLKRMTVSIEGVRPALLSQNTFTLLDRLRAFRHVMRHAYVYDLDERQVRLVLEDALELKKSYAKEIEAFLKKL